MIKIDRRIDNNRLIKGLIGMIFEKYICDPFAFTNGVYQVVSCKIGNKYYGITNIAEPMDYYGSQEEVAVLDIKEIESKEVRSALVNVEQIETNILERITQIDIVNEHHCLFKNEEQIYDVWFTKGIIFHLPEREIAFEKDVWFSEEILVHRGYDLIERFQDCQSFCNDWEEGYLAKSERIIMSFPN